MSTCKKSRGVRSVAPQSPKFAILTKNEIIILLEVMKNYILHLLVMQLVRMHIKTKQEEVEKSLAIMFPKCTKKYARNGSPL